MPPAAAGILEPARRRRKRAAEHAAWL